MCHGSVTGGSKPDINRRKWRVDGDVRFTPKAHIHRLPQAIVLTMLAETTFLCAKNLLSFGDIASQHRGTSMNARR